MSAKSYLAGIALLQEALLWVGVGTLLILPLSLSYFPEQFSGAAVTLLFELSLSAAFFVMSIRPLADLFPKVTWLRPLVILRKGFGVFSAAIIVSFMLSRVMTEGADYFLYFFSPEHWNPFTGAILAPLGDLSALILLVTSNRYSKRALGANWKRVQKLAYVYFYAGALYEYFLLDQAFALAYAAIVATLTVAAFVKKRLPRQAAQASA